MPDQESLLNVLKVIVDYSQGVARIAFQEQDHHEGKARGAGHFLKIGGQRVGRDLEVYLFAAKVKGWEVVLTDLLVEILFPVKNMGLADSYAAAAKAIQEMGHQVYSDHFLRAQWDNLFS